MGRGGSGRWGLSGGEAIRGGMVQYGGGGYGRAAGRASRTCAYAGEKVEADVVAPLPADDVGRHRIGKVLGGMRGWGMGRVHRRFTRVTEGHYHQSSRMAEPVYTLQNTYTHSTVRVGLGDGILSPTGTVYTLGRAQHGNLVGAV